MSKIIVPRIVVRPLLPPKGPKIGVRVQPQYLHWQGGRYKERLTSGPGGLGRGRIWVPEREGEQHNLILDRFYDSLIPVYGFIGSSQYAAVGTGSAAPDPTQTGLQNEVARTNAVPSGEANAIEPLPDYGVYDIKRVYEFTEAQVGGQNLTEWGFGPTSSASSGTMNRELFRDGSGNPIVLTLDTDQRLRLIYRYRITLSPSTPQDVTVNIGGEGPGPRTAKFVLTARNVNGYYPYAGLVVYGPGRGGDLMVCEAHARGVLIGTNGGFIAPSSNAAPLDYLHTMNNIGGLASPDYKSPSFQAVVGRSRRSSILANPNEFNMTIRSVVIASAEAVPTVNLVFDSGQEFTKDNLHKLFIGYWEIVWGP